MPETLQMHWSILLYVVKPWTMRLRLQRSVPEECETSPTVRQLQSRCAAKSCTPRTDKAAFGSFLDFTRWLDWSILSRWSQKTRARWNSFTWLRFALLNFKTHAEISGPQPIIARRAFLNKVSGVNKDQTVMMQTVGLWDNDITKSIITV